MVRLAALLRGTRRERKPDCLHQGRRLRRVAALGEDGGQLRRRGGGRDQEAWLSRPMRQDGVGASGDAAGEATAAKSTPARGRRPTLVAARGRVRRTRASEGRIERRMRRSYCTTTVAECAALEAGEPDAFVVAVSSRGRPWRLPIDGPDVDAGDSTPTCRRRGRRRRPPSVLDRERQALQRERALVGVVRSPRACSKGSRRDDVPRRDTTRSGAWRARAPSSG